MPNWWRSRLAARAAAPAEHKQAQALMTVTSLGEAAWSRRSYPALAREGYVKNPVVNRCVRMIAESATRVPLGIEEDGRRLAEHPVLRLLAAPNPRQSGGELLEMLYAYLQTAGNAYLEAVIVAGEVKGLYALRPDRMRVVAGADGWPLAYEYNAGRPRRLRLDAAPVAQVLHLATFHPLDDHYGLSPLEAAAQSLDIHNAAGRWNKALLDNAARPSGALVYSAAGGNLSDEQFERLKSELEAHYQGAANAGRPLLLEGGLDWKGLSLSPKDMDFVEAKHIAAREIALAFGVPPMLLGIPGDNTYSNYAEANRAFYRQTVVPLIARIAAALGAWLGGSFGGSLRLVPDLDEIPALSVEREALWKRVGEAAFLTDDEKRAAVGYEPLPASSLTTLLAKYDPNQSRVPGGSSDGGQWTSGGAPASGDEERDEELLPEGIEPAGGSVDIGLALTGIERIDIATVELVQTLARVAEIARFTPRNSPQTYGTFVHTLFAGALRLQSFAGYGSFEVEQTWGDVPDAPYGARGTIRTDAVLRNEVGDVIAIYDVKTGNARLTPARVRELRSKTKTGTSVPIIELHVDRGPSLKSQQVSSRISSFWR